MFYVLINALLHWELTEAVEESKRTSPECKRLANEFWNLVAKSCYSGGPLTEYITAGDNQLLLNCRNAKIKDQFELILRDFDRENCKASWAQLDRPNNAVSPTS